MESKSLVNFQSQMRQNCYTKLFPKSNRSTNYEWSLPFLLVFGPPGRSSSEKNYSVKSKIATSWGLLDQFIGPIYWTSLLDQKKTPCMWNNIYQILLLFKRMTNLKVKRDHQWGVLLLVFHPSTHPPICWDESRSGVLPKGQHSWNISVMKEARLDQKVFLDSLGNLFCP